MSPAAAMFLSYQLGWARWAPQRNSLLPPWVFVYIAVSRRSPPHLALVERSCIQALELQDESPRVPSYTPRVVRFSWGRGEGAVCCDSTFRPPAAGRCHQANPDVCRPIEFAF